MHRMNSIDDVIIVSMSTVTNNDLASIDDSGADYQFVDVLQPLGVATLDLMKGVQNDVKLGDTMGDCEYT